MNAELLLFPDTEHPWPGRCAVLNSAGATSADSGRTQGPLVSVNARLIPSTGS
jgi:hypothetical protein